MINKTCYFCEYCTQVQFCMPFEDNTVAISQCGAPDRQHGKKSIEECFSANEEWKEIESFYPRKVMWTRNSRFTEEWKPLQELTRKYLEQQREEENYTTRD